MRKYYSLGISLALVGTVATLANSWALSSSCVDNQQFFCFICLCWPQAPCLQYRSIVFCTEVLPYFCCFQLSELQHRYTSVGVSLCHTPAWEDITIPMVRLLPNIESPVCGTDMYIIVCRSTRGKGRTWPFSANSRVLGRGVLSLGIQLKHPSPKLSVYSSLNSFLDCTASPMHVRVEVYLCND